MGGLWAPRPERALSSAFRLVTPGLSSQTCGGQSKNVGVATGRLQELSSNLDFSDSRVVPLNVKGTGRYSYTNSRARRRDLGVKPWEIGTTSTLASGCALHTPEQLSHSAATDEIIYESPLHLLVVTKKAHRRGFGKGGASADVANVPAGAAALQDPHGEAAAVGGARVRVSPRVALTLLAS